ncbi:ATP-dependent DNA helicase RecG [Treponema parvum]|uniref:ATP-dependent DNA helicase RecG n=1 Tax=Treponema parvum TaxID=138851 RepID=UPI001AEC4C0A|nr:ATP-dependent DNA helicase RecG [Treponema parvum]QTQ16961.1 ATP-dependent DNA helicase RecG [Treponema parvum]
MKLEEIRIPVGSLPDVGPAAVKLFANLNVFTIADLLTLYPRDYEDRTKIVTLSQFNKAKVHTVAEVTAHDWFGYGRMKTLKIYINDKTAEAQLVAFNRPFFEKMLPIGSVIVVSGSFFIKYNSLQSSSFEVIKLSDGLKDGQSLADYEGKPLPDSGVIPIYPLTEGLSLKSVQKAVNAALKQCCAGIDDEIPQEIIAQRQLLSKKDAVRLIHQPAQYSDIEKARQTLIYEELFRFQYSMAERAYEHKGCLPGVENTEDSASHLRSAMRTPAPSMQAHDFKEDLSPLQKKLFEQLSFQLTDDQMNVIRQMNEDIDRGYKERSALLKGDAESISDKPVYTMARLLQGDVGSGKTLVAFFACLRTVNWGGQCAIMAPTEILARQHAENADRLLGFMGIRIAFLTASVHASGRKQLLKALKEGNIDIVIGTHALFSSTVVYKDLQTVVIDEQHRFGVMQRNAIIGKGLQLASHRYVSPHFLMMSATPIPQTLALTAFGDLDVSVIKTMPSGRKPVITYLVREGNEKNVYGAVLKELKAGHQAYFIYPAIEGSSEGSEQNTAKENSADDETLKSVKAAEEAFALLSSKIFPEYQCALLHSKIDEDTQIRVLKEFRDGKIKILVATTVVEVGVDVPSATCMVIEQADRFGLAQLHQLRGRVGRGNAQSYCFLVYGKNITESGIARMKALRENTDGFIIAEEDLKLRGPGELTGTAQSGILSLGISDLVRDRRILEQARADAFNLMQRKLQGG